MKNTVAFADTVWHDVRYALRTFWKNRAFATAAVLTFALGIGATTAIFTVLYGVLLRPLPYRDPERLMQVATGTIARFEEMQAAAQSYTDLGVYPAPSANITLSGEGEAEVLKAASVSANFLRILGVEPLVGRTFSADDELLNSPDVAMISTNLWRRRFASDPSIAGKTTILAGGPATVIGVLPAGFQFPFPGVDVWVTKPTRGMMPATPGLNIFGRLKPGVDVEQASAELTVLTKQYATNHPGMLDAKPTTVAVVTPLRDRVVGSVQSILWMLFAAVGFVLLIACANVANLLLARSHSRSREFAVRAAIGAGRRRIVRQLLVESLLLACAGGAVGVVFGNVSVSAISRMTAFALPRAADIQLDGTVVAFAVATSIVTGLLFGLLPSLGVFSGNLAAALKTGSAGSGSRNSRARAVLVTAQVALSIILLIGATLLMQTMFRLYRVDLHFNPDSVLTAQLSVSPLRYNTEQKRVEFFEQLTGRIESLPGVESAGVAWTLPFMGWPGTPVQPAEREAVPLNERPIAVLNHVDAGYFKTLQMPLRRGRLFVERDDLNAAPVAIINEALARQFWPEYPNGEDPVGHRMWIGANPKPAEIIGVINDILLYPGTEIRPFVYRPYRQAALMGAVVIRTNGNPMQIANGVRDQVRAIDRDQAILAIKTLDTLFEEALGQRRLVLTLLELFAGVAVLLAMVGVYGVTTHTVSQRTREVGVRIALGARATDIVRVLVGHALLITVAGIAIGIGGAFGITRFLKSYLFQVSPTEATTFLAVAVAFVVVASASTYLPLRRATRIDPIAVLRHE